MDVFAIPVLAEMDSMVTARKPYSRRSSKAVLMITASISSGRRRFTDLLSFSILFDIPLLDSPQIEMQGSIARNYRCYDTVRSFTKISQRSTSFIFIDLSHSRETERLESAPDVCFGIGLNRAGF